MALPVPPLALIGAGVAALAAAWALERRRHRKALAAAAADRDRVTSELSRRLGELYSLQALSQVISTSLQFDRVLAEVAGYAMRFLDGAGALVALETDDGAALRVVAAEGTLAPHAGRRIDPEAGGLILDALRDERLELRSASDRAGLRLFGEVTARRAAIAPLKAHGVTTGAVVVVDRTAGGFVIEDARLLSTVAAHAAVALANARLFDLVRRGKEQWEATFDAISEGIALVDETGTIRRANTAFAELVGRPVTAVVAQGLSRALFGDPETLAPFLHEALAGARPASMVRRSDALRRILRVAAGPVARAVDGASVVAVVEDITEQQQLEAQLIQSEKMAAVGTLVSGIAHELNNPLTSIAGLSELLLERGAGTAESARHLRVINEEAERASRIVRDLLTFSRQGSGERRAVDLADVVQRALLLTGYELRHRGVTVEMSLPAGLPRVTGDRDKLQQIVLNLLTNAAHAMSANPPDAPRRVTITAAEQGASIVLRVADTGPGLSDEVRTRMFSPFFTTKAPGEGTGLGLSVSYGIAEAHGGSLTAESEPGRGATLVLTLPAARESGAPPPAPAAAAPRRILVVDDDPVVRQVVAALFGRDGHRVDGTADAAEALRLVKLESYDLVIADRLAAPAGEPLAAALARLPGNRCRRLILSTSDARLAAGTRGGQAPVLKKPFDLRELRKTAEQVMRMSE